jgi:hypothetical protein
MSSTMTEQAISSLRRRMIEDMTIRKFAQKTQRRGSDTYSTLISNKDA